MSRRRILTGLLLLLAAPLTAEAQPVGKIPRLCYLALSPAPRQVTYHAFLQGLRDLGYADGRNNLVIDYLSADGRFERFSPPGRGVCAAQGGYHRRGHYAGGSGR